MYTEFEYYGGQVTADAASMLLDLESRLALALSEFHMADRSGATRTPINATDFLESYLHDDHVQAPHGEYAGRTFLCYGSDYARLGPAAIAEDGVLNISLVDVGCDREQGGIRPVIDNRQNLFPTLRVAADGQFEGFTISHVYKVGEDVEVEDAIVHVPYNRASGERLFQALVRICHRQKAQCNPLKIWRRNFRYASLKGCSSNDSVGRRLPGAVCLWS